MTTDASRTARPFLNGPASVPSGPAPARIPVHGRFRKVL